MAGVVNNLFPPILTTYQPTFIIKDITEISCRIYFSISSYNVFEDIKSIQLRITTQNSNSSVLRKVDNSGNPLYPNGIKLYNASEIGTLDTTDDYKYYIQLSSNDIKGGFQVNQYYKIQIRLGKIAPPLNGEKNSTWLSANTKYFSEWSTVSILHGISQPTLKLANLQDTGIVNSFITSSSTLTVAGTLNFSNKEEKETLKSYQIKLYQNNNLLSDSGVLYTNSYSNSNELNYTLNYMLIDGTSYNLEVTYTTTSLFTQTEKFEILNFQNALNQLAVLINTETIDEIGGIQVSISSTDSMPYTGYIMFRRASSRTNFTVWEDIHKVVFKNTILNYSWIDTTIESGVWYKYCVQRIDTKNNRGVVTLTDEPIMSIFENMYLKGENTQLRIKYNPEVNSYKVNLLESKTDTIGSQFPFIKRNGAMKYRQFGISGLITLHSDYQNSFVSKNSLYGGAGITELYENYNNINSINEYNDYIQEREFRDAVINFLHEDNVKLLRTTTEGNLLIRLMDINFTPNATLGRMLYSFSATAYEIDTYTVENCKKYNLIKNLYYVNTNQEEVETTFIDYIEKRGQIQDTFISNYNLLNFILEKYKILETEGHILKINYLTSLKIIFDGEPYLIKEIKNGELAPLTKNDNPNLAIGVGYIVYINNVAIMVNKKGIYELVDEDTKVTNIYFPTNTAATIDFLAQFSSITDLTEIYFFSNYIIGQLFDIFEYEERLKNRIKDRYDYRVYSSFFFKLMSIDGLKIEGDPGTVCYIKDTSSNDFKRFIINDTGIISIYDDNSVIEEFYFSGLHLEPVESGHEIRKFVPSNRFIETNINVSSVDEIKNPMNHGVYTISNTRYIFHNSNWYVFTNENDILCPVWAMVDYLCEVAKGVYLQ